MYGELSDQKVVIVLCFHLKTKTIIQNRLKLSIELSWKIFIFRFVSMSHTFN